jgi:hypothetical protein
MRCPGFHPSEQCQILSNCCKKQTAEPKGQNESEHNYFNSISLLKNSMAVWPTCSVS